MAEPTTAAVGDTTGASAAPRSVPPRLRGALLRYRVLAYTVGTGLVILTFVGIPLQIWGHNDSVATYVGIAHGYLYITYVVLVFDLARRARWSLKRTGGVVLAGTIPLLGFFVERWVTHKTIAEQ
jgi:integral membrane protein